MSVFSKFIFATEAGLSLVGIRLSKEPAHDVLDRISIPRARTRINVWAEKLVNKIGQEEIPGFLKDFADSMAKPMNEIQIRGYYPRLAVDVILGGTEHEALTEGFGILGHYIFGRNISKLDIVMAKPVDEISEKIEMTMPVSQLLETDGRWCVRFYMPSDLTPETLPAPKDERIHITQLPAETLAVFRFHRFPSAELLNENRKILGAAIAGKWNAVGRPVTYYYDPPWTLPALRRNEVAIPVRRHTT